jgi:flavin-dependent dehydrogenase
VGSNITEYDITEGNRICKILNELDVKPKKISPISEWISPNYSYILHSKIEDFYFKRGAEKDTLENLLFEKLNKNFISVFFKSKVDSIKIKEKEVVEVEVDKYIEKIKIKPNYVIVADGADSDFRRKMNVETNKFAKFNGFGVLIESDKNDVIPHSKIYFNQKIAPGGYIYSGSVGKESFFCIVTDDIFNNKKSLKQYLNKLLKHEIKGEYTVKNYFGGTGISGIQEVIIGNVFFIGSAALFHDPFFGYGLNYAIESSYYAATAIEKNDFEIYSKYVNKIQQKFKDLFFAREIWRRADNNFFDQTIKAFNEEFITDSEVISKILKLFDESQIEI